MPQFYEGELDRCLDDVAIQPLWTLLLSLLPHPQERVFLIATYRDGDMPRDLVQRYPHFFPTVKVVYAIRQRVVKHLQRHRAVRAYREDVRALAHVSRPLRLLGHHVRSLIIVE